MARKGELEKVLNARLVRHFKKLQKDGHQIKWYKTHGGPYSSQAGTPDFHVTYYGQSFWFEMKTIDYKPQPLQIVELRRWQAAGAITGLCYSVEDVTKILDKFRQERGIV